ncbi:hypothetical protein GGX14DRAFT_534298 [Mycena pura]|uniref:Uncharacterized protein n=1 Tax=Mycena pura TaxID=153505 RepID=A0AAD6YEY6_9AGAR|nr:hypothetical protein GGX14DRAFT_534298 [Mycena pura]
MDGLPPFAHQALLEAFRTHYQRFVAAMSEIVGSQSDAIVIARLGDDLDEFAAIAAAAKEYTTLQTSLATMQNDIRLEYQDARSTASIHRFLRVSRTTAQNALIAEGIRQPQSNPFPSSGNSSFDNFITTREPPDTIATDSSSDDILDPNLPIPSAAEFPQEIQILAAQTRPMIRSTGPISNITDDELDMLIIRLRTHYRRAGLSMLNGMLRRLGYHIPMDRIRQSLLRIDPVRRIFERIRIRRREYRVLGPNSLWHHDGQHGGSVHNIRIERLWVDVTAQPYMAVAFSVLGTINSQLNFFAESWNEHRIQIRNGPNRSPIDMFVFDTFVNGVRGDRLPPEEENLTDEELETYGIDWQGLRDDTILHSQLQNNPYTEDATSWIGYTGPPPNLSEVSVQPPSNTLTEREIHIFEFLLPSQSNQQ